MQNADNPEGNAAIAADNVEGNNPGENNDALGIQVENNLEAPQAVAAGANPPNIRAAVITVEQHRSEMLIGQERPC